MMGFAQVQLLTLVYNDALVEISLTLATAYATFYLAEEVFHSSGVLAVVVLGVVMSATGRTRVSPRVHESLHVFWEMLEFLANTLIFVFAGTIIATVRWGWAAAVLMPPPNGAAPAGLSVCGSPCRSVCRFVGQSVCLSVGSFVRVVAVC